mgnify:CR=1 FL=1
MGGLTPPGRLMCGRMPSRFATVEGKSKQLSAPSLRGSLTNTRRTNVAPIGQLHGAKLSSFQHQAYVGAPCTNGFQRINNLNKKGTMHKNPKILRELPVDWCTGKTKLVTKRPARRGSMKQKHFSVYETCLLNNWCWKHEVPNRHCCVFCAECSTASAQGSPNTFIPQTPLSWRSAVRPNAAFGTVQFGSNTDFCSTTCPSLQCFHKVWITITNSNITGHCGCDWNCNVNHKLSQMQFRVHCAKSCRPFELFANVNCKLWNEAKNECNIWERFSSRSSAQSSLCWDERCFCVKDRHASCTVCYDFVSQR